MPLPRTNSSRKPRLPSRLQHGHPLVHGLEACYLFNEGAGLRAYDLTGNGHDIRLNTAPNSTTNTAWTGGPHGGPALVFRLPTGSNSGNLARNFTFSSAQSWTVETWIHPLSSSDGYGCLLTVDGNSGLFIRNQVGTNFRLIYFDTADRTGATSLGLNQWHHCVVSLRVGATTRVLRFYVDGRFDGIATPGSALAANWDEAFNDAFSERFVGFVDTLRVWNRVLSDDEVSLLYQQPFAMFAPARAVFPRFNQASPFVLELPATRAVYRVSTPVASLSMGSNALYAEYRPGTVIVSQPVRAVVAQYVVQRIRRTLGATEVNLSPGRILLRANDLAARISTRINITPGVVVLRANDLIVSRGTFTVPAVRAQYALPVPTALTFVMPRNPGITYYDGLVRNFIAGDWIIQAPAIGLKLSLHYNPDGTWDHRIVAISPIEIRVPPGGGIASVANVTVSVAEDGRIQSILQIWAQTISVNGVRITIDFLLDGQTVGLRVFTGRIDSIRVNDAVTEILCVDDSIHRDLLLPQRLVTSAMFANADSRVLTQPIPLVYGNGDTVLAAPLMLVDIPTNTYVAADHTMTMTSTIAVLVPEVNRYLTYDAEATLNQTSALIMLNKPVQEVRFNTLQVPLSISENVNVTNAAMAIDGFSTTIATILTSSVNSNLDGYGALGIRTAATADQRGNNTVVISLVNHRRALASDPTVTGTFAVQTLDSTTGAVLRDRLFVTEHFRHSLNPLTTSFTAPSINLGANEAIEVRCVANNEGGPGTAGATTTTTTTTTAMTVTATSMFGTQGAAAGEFSGPLGVAIHPTTGDIYAADFLNNRIQQFTASGVFIRQWGTFGTGNSQFANGPYGVAYDAVNDYILVVDHGNSRVQRFTASGVFVSAFGSGGSGNGEFLQPFGIAVSAAGDIWVADGGNNRIQRFDNTGVYVSQFGSEGTLPGQFQAPVGIAVKANGDLWVVDARRSLVQIFTNAGVYVSQFGSMGSALGQFLAPDGIAIDALTGTAFIADTGNNRVQWFDASGTAIGATGSSGTALGAFQSPTFLALNAGGSSLVISDYANNRLQILTVATLTTTTTTTTTDANDVYEVGEIGIESFFQPTGDSQQIFLYDDGWQGRTDVDGSVTGSVGMFLHTPADVIASLLVTEVGIVIDQASFANAGTFYRSQHMTTDGGIGFGWFVQRAALREILDALARQAFAILFPSFTGNWSIMPFRDDTMVAASFDTANILYTAGAQTQAGDERQSTFDCVLGNLETVYNRFEVHYHYNAGVRTFDQVYYADQDGTNSPDGTLVQGPCQESYLRYGALQPLVIDAYWIADDLTAQRLLRHIVNYFSEQRITVTFETTLYAAPRQVGDFVSVTYPTLPAADNGKTFEIHGIRYLPLDGRVQITASRKATLGHALSPPALRAVYRVGTPMVLKPILAPPVSVQYAVAGTEGVGAPLLTGSSIVEPWEFVTTSTPRRLYTEEFSF